MEPITPVVERLRHLLTLGRDGEAQQTVNQLGERLAAFSDPRMRSTIIHDALRSYDDAGLLAFLERLLNGSEEGGAHHREILQELALEPDFFQQMEYDRLADLYRVARMTGLDSVAKMLLGDRAHTNPTVAEANLENEHLALSAGQRKAAARTRDRFTLDRILHDKNPGVIRNLLNNPRTIESDVVRIAATRPTRPAILQMIARHPRWRNRYTIRKALVCNPYTPTSVALRLLPTLMIQDLRVVISTADVVPHIKDEARLRLSRQRLRRTS